MSECCECGNNKNLISKIQINNCGSFGIEKREVKICKNCLEKYNGKITKSNYIIWGSLILLVILIGLLIFIK
jgi:uncharacterized membrane protein YvbJ